eukprot:TRINITY_DN8948_c0_g1_i1.p1 TRINITY_DN8948_c0_g1~~TRINITY_DN8948_c0_g1_i1.p1  ORF type:complete len:764 (+),score=199.94 TRINITY_DN8948_c0_g1_i1:65-2356(+)
MDGAHLPRSGLPEISVTGASPTVPGALAFPSYPLQSATAAGAASAAVPSTASMLSRPPRSQPQSRVVLDGWSRQASAAQRISPSDSALRVEHVVSMDVNEPLDIDASVLSGQPPRSQPQSRVVLDGWSRQASAAQRISPSDSALRVEHVVSMDVNEPLDIDASVLSGQWEDAAVQAAARSDAAGEPGASVSVPYPPASSVTHRLSEALQHSLLDDSFPSFSKPSIVPSTLQPSDDTRTAWAAPASAPSCDVAPAPQRLVAWAVPAHSQSDAASGLSIDAEHHPPAATPRRGMPKQLSPPRTHGHASQLPPYQHQHQLQHQHQHPAPVEQRLSPPRARGPAASMASLQLHAAEQQLREAATREAAVAQREDAAAAREHDLHEREALALRMRAGQLAAEVELPAHTPPATPPPQHDPRDAALTHRERAVAQRMQGIERREEDVADREGAVQSRESDLARRVRDYELNMVAFMQERGAMERDKLAVARERAGFKERETEVAEREKNASLVEQKAAAADLAAAQRKSFSEQRQAAVLAQERETRLDLGERERAVAEQEARLLDLKLRLQEIEHDVSRRESQAHIDLAAAAAKEVDLKEREATLASRLAEFEPRAAEMERVEVVLAQQREMLEAATTTEQHRQHREELRLREWEAKLQRREAQSGEIDASLEMKLRVVREAQDDLARREAAALRREEAVARLERAATAVPRATAMPPALPATPRPVLAARENPAVSPDLESSLDVQSDLSAIRARLAAIKRQGVIVKG